MLPFLFFTCNLAASIPEKPERASRLLRRLSSALLHQLAFKSIEIKLPKSYGTLSSSRRIGTKTKSTPQSTGKLTSQMPIRQLRSVSMDLHNELPTERKYTHTFEAHQSKNRDTVCFCCRSLRHIPSKKHNPNAQKCCRQRKL